MANLEHEQVDMEKARFLDDEEGSEGDSSVLRSPSMTENRGIRRFWWLALNFGILLLSALVNISTWWISSTSNPTCVKQSDMQDARSAIEYEQRTFTGALLYDPDTKRAFRKQDARREYFGYPSDELDDAWDELLHGEFPVMTDEEAAPYEPELRRIPKTKQFHFEPDMFHTLHCVNAVRLEISKSLYNVSVEHDHGLGKLPEGWEAAHMEHCMDRIRQSVMCAGDLTPSPMYIWDGFTIALGRSGEHTCRKWEPIREWMNQRGERGPVLGD